MQNIEPLALAEDNDSYDAEDFSMLFSLESIRDSFPDNVFVQKAVCYVRNFMQKVCVDDFVGGGISFVYRNNGECTYYDFELSQNRLSIVSGGIVRSDCGSDPFSNEIWRLETGGHADGFRDVAEEVVDLINCGGAIKLIDGGLAVDPSCQKTYDEIDAMIRMRIESGERSFEAVARLMAENLDGQIFSKVYPCLQWVWNDNANGGLDYVNDKDAKSVFEKITIGNDNVISGVLDDDACAENLTPTISPDESNEQTLFCMFVENGDRMMRDVIAIFSEKYVFDPRALGELVLFKLDRRYQMFVADDDDASAESKQFQKRLYDVMDDRISRLLERIEDRQLRHLVDDASERIVEVAFNAAMAYWTMSDVNTRNQNYAYLETFGTCDTMKKVVYDFFKSPLCYPEPNDQQKIDWMCEIRRSSERNSR